jgi:signal transduction histidine kinase
MEQSGIRVTDFPDEPIYVWADEFLVEEVITNYISNAIHYAAGEKEIRIFYEKKDACVRVHVFNSGSGIPESDLDKIWDKFYKVDKARTREYGGSGIGLSIVKAVMESMHRECGVQNAEDGVIFWFELDTTNQ